MSIVINGRILENRYTTSEWQYINPILADRVEGYETDNAGNPIGMKMGNGINTWDDLPYWFSKNSKITIDKTNDPNLAAGSTYPYFLDITVYPQFDKTALIETLASDGTGKLQVWDDMPVIRQDTNNDGTGIFTGWNIFAHTNDGATLSQDLTLEIIGGDASLSTPPIGPASAPGDLTGTYPNNITVAKFNGQLPSFYLAYGNLTGKPTDLSAFTNGPSYVTLARLIAQNSANFGQTVSATMVSYTDPGLSDNTYRVGAWFRNLSGSGYSIKISVTYTDESNTGTTTKDFFEQGSTTAAQTTNGAYAFPTFDFRIKIGTTITIFTTVSGSIIYDGGGTIQLLG